MYSANITPYNLYIINANEIKNMKTVTKVQVIWSESELLADDTEYSYGEFEKIASEISKNPSAHYDKTKVEVYTENRTLPFTFKLYLCPEEDKGLEKLLTECGIV